MCINADTPGSITSPKVTDRSPLQGRTLNTLLGIHSLFFFSFLGVLLQGLLCCMCV